MFFPLLQFDTESLNPIGWGALGKQKSNHGEAAGTELEPIVFKHSLSLLS